MGILVLFGDKWLVITCYVTRQCFLELNPLAWQAGLRKPCTLLSSLLYLSWQNALSSMQCKQLCAFWHSVDIVNIYPEKEKQNVSKSQKSHQKMLGVARTFQTNRESWICMLTGVYLTAKTLDGSSCSTVCLYLSQKIQLNYFWFTLCKPLFVTKLAVNDVKKSQS